MARNRWEAGASRAPDGFPNDRPTVASSPTPPWSDKRWLVFGAALLAFLAGLWIHRHFFHDDAYISLRYGERWLSGKGLTWNDGERVEGFSSPLWLGQIIMLGFLGVPLPLAAQVLGVLYALATFVLWHRAEADPVGLLALVSVPGWPLWTLGGLDTISACFWILASMVLVWRMQDSRSSRAILLGFSLVAVALSRPEGIAVSVMLLAVAAGTRRWPNLLISATTLAVGYGAYQVFRLATFGDWVANAARAKALGLPFGSRLTDAATYVVATAPQWLAAAFVGAWLIAWSPDRRHLFLLLLSCLPLLAVVVAGGGDHMLGARFMLAPVAVVCFAGSLGAWGAGRLCRPRTIAGGYGEVGRAAPGWGGRAWRAEVPEGENPSRVPMTMAWGAGRPFGTDSPPCPPRTLRARATLLLAAITSVWQLQLSWRHPAGRNPAAAVGELVGHVLQDKLPPGTLVAATTAGSVPYFARSLSFIDTLGLNDRHIAHTLPAPVPRALAEPDSWFFVPGHVRGDGAYVVSRQPDVVMLGGANGDLGPTFLGDFQLLMSERFRAEYAPWRWLVPVPASYRPWVVEQIDRATGALPITLYVRRDSRVWPVVARQGELLIPPWAASQ